MANSSPFATVIIKPDAHRDVMAEMIARDLQEGGLDIIFRKDIIFSREQAEKIYFEERGKANFPNAAQSLLGTDKHKFSTLLILKSQEGRDGLLKAQNIKGKVGQGGIRETYHLYAREELEKMGLTSEELKNELAKNRLHVPDTDKKMIEIIDMLLAEREKMDLKEREPELYNELLKLRENREVRRELSTRKWIK